MSGLGLPSHLGVLAFLFALAAGATACTLRTDEASAGHESADATEAASLERYSAIVKAAGGEMNPQGTATVLGLRGARRGGDLHETRTGTVFDDTFVVLTADHRVVELSGSTHPWFTHSTLSPDVDGDGVRDVAMIRPGLYEVVGRPASANIGGSPTYHVLTPKGSDALPAWRDTRHDGSFDAAERLASEARHDTAGAILFHLGGLSSVPAIGCQVFPDADLRRLVDAVGGPQARFNYVLVDANAIAAPEKDAP